MRVVLAFVWMLVAFSASAQPLLRNFFTTNGAPVNQVTAGSNVFVTFSTSGSDTRTYKIDVPALGSVSNIYVAAGTGVTITTNGALYTFTVSTNYASTNYVNTATNDLNTGIVARINTATNDAATRTTNATNDLNTLVKTYTNAVGIIQIITNSSPLAMSITGNAASASKAPYTLLSFFASANAYSANTLYYLPVVANGGTRYTTEIQANNGGAQVFACPSLTGGYVSNFWVLWTADNTGAGSNFGWTLQTNGASTAMKVVMSAPQNGALSNDLTHVFFLTNGSYWSVQFTNNCGIGSSRIMSWGVTVNPQ